MQISDVSGKPGPEAPASIHLTQVFNEIHGTVIKADDDARAAKSQRSHPQSAPEGEWTKTFIDAVAHTSFKNLLIAGFVNGLFIRDSGIFKKAPGVAGVAVLDNLLDNALTSRAKSGVIKDVLAPNLLETIGIGYAFTQLPKGKLALGIAAGAWVFGRAENYLEHKYKWEERSGAVGLHLAGSIWNSKATKFLGQVARVPFGMEDDPSTKPRGESGAAERNSSHSFDPNSIPEPERNSIEAP